MAMMGSSIPVAPVEPGLAHTLERPFPFGQRFHNSIRHSIEEHGVARINGPGHTKVSWVATADVARIAAAVLHDKACSKKTLELPGVTLTWLGMVEAFQRALGRPVAIRRTPLFLLSLLGGLVGLFVSKAGGALIDASVAAAADEMLPDGYEFRRIFPHYVFQTPEQFLRERLELGKMPLAHTG